MDKSVVSKTNKAGDLAITNYQIYLKTAWQWDKSKIIDKKKNTPKIKSHVQFL